MATESRAVMTPHSTELVTTETLDFNVDNYDMKVSDYAVNIVQLVVLVIACGLISSAGLVANTINFIVFFRQGALSSSSNLSLLALTLADIGSLIPILATSISFYFVKLGGLFLTERDFINVATFWTHIMFVQMSGYFTAYISLERCICVMLPFKAKSLFSGKRALVINTTIAIVTVLSFIPTFSTQRLQEFPDKNTNETKVRVLWTDTHFKVISVTSVINTIALRNFVLVMVFVCTQITVCRIRNSQTWRKTATTSEPKDDPKEDLFEPPGNGTDSKTNGNCGTGTGTGTLDKVGEKLDGRKKSALTPLLRREIRLIRVITSISVIYIMCNLPAIVSVFILRLLPSLDNLSPFDNVFEIVLSCRSLMASVNASINILVYYKMSTRYRAELKLWLGGANIRQQQ